MGAIDAIRILVTALPSILKLKIPYTLLQRGRIIILIELELRRWVILSISLDILTN